LEEQMNIYVGNLAREASEEDLRAIFAEFGQVSRVTILKDRLSGEPRGFGFVEMSSPEEAKAAIESANGRQLKGQSLRVNEARPREDNPDRGGGDRPRRPGGGGGGRRGW
jgi:RNA recognition motif-containing protein